MTFVQRHRQARRETWRITRPERGNGLGTTLARELVAALDELEAALPLPSVLVLTAEPVVKGPRRTWIAGGDLKELAALATGDEARVYASAMAAVIERLGRLPVPVVIAVDGAAIGGGAELALAGDVRLATAASHLEFRQLKAALATGYGTARRLVQLVGLGRAQGWLYGCKTVSAAEAHAAGLIHEVVAGSAELAAAVDRTCLELEQLAPEAFAAQKRMLWHAAESHAGAARAAELDIFAALWRNPGHQAFLEDFAARKREP